MNPWNLTDVEPTAQGVISFMERVWDTSCESAPDGGVVMHASELYDEFHNAREVARGVGFKQVAPTLMNGGTGVHIRA